MNNLFRSLIIVFGIMLLPAIALGTTYPTVLQVIQDQIVLDNTTVESATLRIPEEAGRSYGVYLTLKPTAAQKINKMLEANIGKRANIIANEKVVVSAIIQSKVGKEFLVTTGTKEQAQQFIKSLQLQ